MQKTILSPIDQAQLEQWVFLLKEAQATYRLIPVGRQTRLEVEPDIAESVLGIQPRKPWSKGMKITVISLWSLFALTMIGIVIGNNQIEAEQNAVFVDYKSMIGKTKADLIKTYGEPKEADEIKENCPTGGCWALDFTNGLTVTLRNDKVARFEFTVPEADEDNYLSKIGIETDREPDALNDVFTSWYIVKGLDVTVVKTNDGQYSYIVELLNEEGKAKALRRQKIEKLFDPSLDGQVPAVMNSIMNSMHDSWSYEHIRTAYSDKGDPDFVYIECAFRGKNAFGAKVVNTALAKVDLDGNVLEIELVD